MQGQGCCCQFWPFCALPRHRTAEHLRQGRKAARYLRAHRPARLVFSQEVGSRSLALKVECRFKQLTRSQKERVVRDGELYFDAESGRIEVPGR